MQAHRIDEQGSSRAAHFARALERILRPVVRLVVGRIGAGYLVHEIRKLYVQEARAWLVRNEPGTRVTRSRLAMLTGLDTRTIASIEGESEHHVEASDLCAEAVVIERWSTLPDFLDDDGSPAVMPLMGPKRTFQALVARAVGRNITAHTVLERLLESGNVECADEQFVRLVNPVYQPLRESEQAAIEAGSHSIARLTESIIHNSRAVSASGRNLQQDRWCSRVPPEQFDELRGRARALIEKYIVEMESLMCEYETEEAGDELLEFGVGWYVFDSESQFAGRQAGTS